jgi:predicted kinase
MPAPRSVKIDDDERGAWSSDRPRRRRGGQQVPDVAVRGRILEPTDRLRYTPGSLVVIACGSRAARDRFVERVVEDRGAVLSADRVRALLAGRVAEAELEERAAQLLDAAIAKRLEAGQSVVLAAQGADPDERARAVRLAHRFRRPRHLILVEVPADQLDDADRTPLNELRRRLVAGQLGAEGFHTSLRLGGAAIGELKRLVFRPPPEDE